MLNSKTMKSVAVCNFELSIFTMRLDFASKGLKKRGQKSKVNQLYRGKKRTFECAGRFSDFFIKIEGSQVLNKNRLSSFDIKLHYFHSFYYLSSFLEYPCFFVNLYCLNFLKLWEKKSFQVSNYLKKKRTELLNDFFFRGSLSL